MMHGSVVAQKNYEYRNNSRAEHWSHEPSELFTTSKAAHLSEMN